jgi:hypothetical protein
VLFLDEGTANLDEDTERKVVDMIGRPADHPHRRRPPPDAGSSARTSCLRLEGGRLRKIEKERGQRAAPTPQFT